MWTKEWPTEPEWYWFYGKLYNHDSHTRYYLIEVRKSRYATVHCVAGGSIIFESDSGGGWWQKAILPDPPEEVEV